MKTKFFFTTLIVTLLAMALTACGAGGTPAVAPPAAPTATFNLADSADDIVGTWRNPGLNSAFRFNADGTYRYATRLGNLDDEPNVKGTFRFEGTKLLLAEAEVVGVGGCEDVPGIPSYEVRLLESGNIQLAAVEDECTRRSGALSLEYEPVSETSAATQSGPAAVIIAINEKMNAGDVDGVMALIADNAVFYNAPGQAGGAKLDTRDAIRNWIQRQVDTNTMAEISDIQVNGEAVTWHVKVTRNGSLLVEGQDEAKVKDGKLVEWTF
jgi:ketosteroid isomerase-like protein/predicted small lipoprotein YifL